MSKFKIGDIVVKDRGLVGGYCEMFEIFKIYSIRIVIINEKTPYSYVVYNGEDCESLLRLATTKEIKEYTNPEV